MTSVLTAPESFADVLQRIGDVPLDRILARPAPGNATLDDVVRLCGGEPKRLVELVDGVLVEKVVGNQESRFAIELSFLIRQFLRSHDLGFLTGADGPHQLGASVVRLPDIAFIPWENIPKDADARTPVPDWVPSLAVEVISAGNTRNEMQRKLVDFFSAGVQMVWYVYQDKRLIRVYKSAESFVTLTDGDELDGEAILPGFRVSVRTLFDEATRLRPCQPE